MMKKNSLVFALAYLLSVTAYAQDKITVFAAASLTNAITDIAAAYEKDQLVQIQTSFASSSTLAKQLEKGAPVDIFLSADNKWMDYLDDKNVLLSSSKKPLLGNQLVLIAPKGRGFMVNMSKEFEIANAFTGRLCTGEFESVPVGIYAKQALKNLNWWDTLKTRLVGTQDVRAALAFVERGECDTGIVYATDAKVSSKVDLVAHFPANSHDAIVYPLALIKGANKSAIGFYNYLQSPYATAIFSKYGFLSLIQN